MAVLLLRPSLIMTRESREGNDRERESYHVNRERSLAGREFERVIRQKEKGNENGASCQLFARVDNRLPDGRELSRARADRSRIPSSLAPSHRLAPPPNSPYILFTLIRRLSFRFAPSTLPSLSPCLVPPPAGRHHRTALAAVFATHRETCAGHEDRKTWKSRDTVRHRR